MDISKFRAALRDDRTLELTIYEFIGEDWYGEGTTSKTVKAQIDASAGRYDRLLVCINSPGGDAFEGIGIYNVLRATGKPIEVRIDGVAASAASIIAMAGDIITMGPNTMMMVHNAWAFCMGNAADMRKMADDLEKISTAIGQTYVTKTKLSSEQIQALMDAETWLTAQECVEQGFATKIVEDPSTPEALAAARNFKALARLKNVPSQLKAATPPPEVTQEAPPAKKPPASSTAPESAAPPRASSDGCACTCSECKGGDCSACTNEDCDDANCEGCPMQAESAEASSNLSLYEARWKARRSGVR